MLTTYTVKVQLSVNLQLSFDKVPFTILFNTSVNGVLDTKHYGDEINRAWVFRALGYGHDVSWWKDLVSNLRLVGYDGVLSIEHEDSLMSIDEGLKKAVAVLDEAIMRDPKPSTMSWA